MKILHHSIIDNLDVAGPGSIVSINPATETELATVSALDRSGAERAIAAARAAYPAWSTTAVEERTELLGRWLKIMVAEAGELAALASAEMGKPIAEAMLVDVTPGCATLDYWQRTAAEHLAFRPETPELLLASHWRAGYRFDL